MQGLLTLDVELFRWINLKLINPVFDVLMPFVSGNVFFFPVLVLVGFLLVCKGGARGRLCVLMLALIIPLGDGFVCNTIKHAVGRPRPYDGLSGVHRPGIPSEPVAANASPTGAMSDPVLQPANHTRTANSMPSSCTLIPQTNTEELPCGPCQSPSTQRKGSMRSTAPSMRKRAWMSARMGLPMLTLCVPG